MQSKQPQESLIWYFAYGANMSPDVLVKQRKVRPQKQVTAGLPGYALEFNVPGVPYSEPGMAGLRPLTDPEEKNGDIVHIYGIAYLISQEDFAKIIATEGAGVAYKVLQATGRIVVEEDGETGVDGALGQEFSVFTLVARRPARTIRSPSMRYLVLLVNAAKAQNLPQEYQEWLSQKSAFQPPKSSPRYDAGKWLFNIVWLRVQRRIQTGIVKYRDANGLVPYWFLHLFDFLLVLMWVQHDYFHCLLWGRGDGM